MKARVLSFFEIEERFRSILIELARHPPDEDLIVKMGRELGFALGLCISQMKAPDSNPYPKKAEHIQILESASCDITYKFNTCTVEQIATQVNAAYRAFSAQQTH